MKKLLLVEHGTSIKKYAVQAALGNNLDVFLVTNKPDEDLYKWFPKDHVITANIFDSHDLLIKVSMFLIQRDIHFDAVGTFRENCVIPTAGLADALGLRGVSSQGACRSSQNKALMRYTLSESQYENQPEYTVLNIHADNSSEVFQTFPKPCVVKPLFGTASHGVLLCDKDKTLQEVIDFIQDTVTPKSREIFYKFDGSVLLEEYCPGSLVSVDGLVVDGVPHPVGTVEFLMGEEPHFTQVASFIPARLSEARKRELNAEALKVIDILGFQTCGFHCEFRVTDSKIKLIEIAARLPGATIHDTYKRVYGFDLVKGYLDSLFGGVQESTMMNPKMMYHHLVFPKITATSRLLALEGIGSVESQTQDFVQLVELGDILHTYPDAPTPLFGYLLEGTDVESLESRARALDESVTYQVEVLSE